MKLTSLQYSEHVGASSEWILNSFELNDINLIVGKNAGGKTRTLNVINGLGKIIVDTNVSYRQGDYYATFIDNGSIIKYELRFFSTKIIKEVLTIDGKNYLERSTGGQGEMYNEQVGVRLKFKIPESQTAVSRRDEYQYPYLNKLYDWGKSIRYFQFNGDAGKNSFVQIDPGYQKSEVALEVTNNVIEVLIKGQSQLGKPFTDAIIADMACIGYDISSIGYGKQISLDINNATGNIVGILAKEVDRNSLVDQVSMSTGMYRALSVIIYFNYYNLRKLGGTILIDDIGEGLDFDRSTKLIKLLAEKAASDNIQLIMTTNDRFVMNNVPLEYWQIIDRYGSKVSVYNHMNSRETFDEFEFTGLNNFDFFTTEFYKHGFNENDELNEPNK